MLQAQLNAERNKILKMFHVLIRRKVKQQGTDFNRARRQAYLWLAKQMNLKPDQCNISVFDHDECQRADIILSRYVKKEAEGLLL